MRTGKLFVLAVAAAALVSSSPVPAAAPAAVPGAAEVQTPEAFFGFTIGADGELARYPKVLEYFQHLAKQTDRVSFEEIGKTTMGNSFALVTISSPANLKRFDAAGRDQPATGGSARADRCRGGHARRGRPAVLPALRDDSLDRGRQRADDPAARHKLATENSPAVREMLDNSVLLLVPSQNPDGQHLVIDHWYKTKGTNFNRVYPDLYHKYAGHDDNRDWFMFTQKETRMMVERVQNHYKPTITHDMHQQGSGGSRIFVPPFQDPFDPNIHPILARSRHRRPGDGDGARSPKGRKASPRSKVRPVGAGAAVHAVSRAAAHPHRDRLGESRRSVRQSRRRGSSARAAGVAAEFPRPYSKGNWTLAQIVDYGLTATLAGISHVAKYRIEFLTNFYKVHKDWVNWKGSPYAFVVPACSAIRWPHTSCSTCCASAPSRLSRQRRRSRRAASATTPGS